VADLWNSWNDKRRMVNITNRTLLDRRHDGVWGCLRNPAWQHVLKGCGCVEGSGGGVDGILSAIIFIVPNCLCEALPARLFVNICDSAFSAGELTHPASASKIWTSTSLQLKIVSWGIRQKRDPIAGVGDAALLAEFRNKQVYDEVVYSAMAVPSDLI
jgi:hypothetical protein